MRYLKLRPHVGYGLVGGRPVFLDVARDLYVALEPESEALFMRVRQRAGRVHAESRDAAPLLATGLFELGDAPGPIDPARIDIPARGLSPGGAAFRPIDAIEAGALIWRARLGLRARALGRLLGALEHRRSQVQGPINAAETERLTERFLGARALVPIAPSCLQDSLALATWLARRSASPALVFGVKRTPFAAHCWVQTSSVILNDAPDRVAEFTPVLVLR